MQGKSRSNKRKHPHQSKKSRAIQRQASAVAGPAPGMPVKPVVPAAKIPAAKPVTPASSPAVPAKQTYPYVISELRRIGILAGVIVAVLIILSIVLT